MVNFTSKGWSSWNNKLVGPRVCVLSSSSSLFCVQNVCGKKGKKMCCVRAGTFEILHHLSLSLSLSLSLICFLQCSSIQPWKKKNHGTPNPPNPPKTKPKNQKKKLHKKNHTNNKSQTDPFSASSGSIQLVPRDFSKEMLKRDVIYDIIIYLSIAPFCLFCFCVLLFSQFSQFSQFFLFFCFCLSLSLSLSLPLSLSLLSVSYFQCDVVVRSR